MTGHTPVLLAEALEILSPRPGGFYVDCTIGAGGHSAAILGASAPDGRVLGIDRDGDALRQARERLAPFGARVSLVHGNFRDLKAVLMQEDAPPPDGILLDLGVSSMQLDQGARGFSYRAEAPLDMRMDRSQGLTAADLVNSLPERELAEILAGYGEERWAARIAQCIVSARAREPILTTGRLAELVKEAIPAAARRQGPHPARRTFQALRIRVNDELGILERTLEDAVEVLRPGGRIAVISFHSLEDRIVKRTFACLGKDCICPPGLPACGCGHRRQLRSLTRHPLEAGEIERTANPRARSAKLRGAEKLALV